MALPPYNPDALCPKCSYQGEEHIGTSYHPSKMEFFTGSNCIYDEHLHRYCPRCRYDWCEAVKEEEGDAQSDAAVTG